MATITLRFSRELLDGLEEVLHLAERGRRDYEEQAQYGDYTEEELAKAGESWKKAESAIASVRAQVGSRDSDPIFEAVERFTGLTRYWVEDDIWQKTSCSEAEASAELFKIMGHPEDASWVIRTHAQSDTDVEDAHHQLYLEVQAEKLATGQVG
ncbi:hypothetical protein ACTXJX_11895 [Glutamicibacter ardleyensis]|uniref:hypothetical protein n=1 Tax=Glutamicibacter ardleyensis TaxID=225894 RepID=UPI003FD02220